MTESPVLPYRLVDADNHYYEPYDCFTRHIESEFRDRVVHIVPGDDGLGRVYVGEQRVPYLSVIQTDYIGAPGALQAVYEGGAERRFVHVEPINARDYPAFMERGARLELMDDQNIEAVIQLPTFGLALEHDLRHDVAASYANYRSFNRWLEDDWGYGTDGRIFGVPLLSLLDVDLAIAELERVLERGARLVHLKPGPVYGRSPADPEFDPFWARVQEANVPVLFHVGNPGYTELFSVQWGEAPTPTLQNVSAFQYLTCTVDRPIFDTMAALVLHNLFGRFPRLRVISIENGSEWVAPLLKGMDKAARANFSGGSWLGGPIAGTPSDIFREHVSIAPFHEDDVDALVDLIGADRVLFGSDFPHPEGLAVPGTFTRLLARETEEEKRLIMRENTAALLGLASQREVH